MAAAVHPPLTPFAVSTPEREAMAVSVPGADSTALAPCRLREVDLEVAGEGGVHLSLVRYFNSFFQPKGELGTGWTWDLPRLNMTWIPKTRTDYGSERLGIQELVTPLNSLYARFSRVEQVAALNNSRLHVPDKPCEILALAGADNPLLLTAKTKLIFRDGRCWFFDENGRFVAAESKPVTTVYHWDENGRVIRISEYSGDREAATIRLDYDHQGRVCAATPTDPREAVIPPGSSHRKGLFARLFTGHETAEAAGESGDLAERRVTFEYHDNGMLASVNSLDGKVTYTYENGLVATVTRVPGGADAAVVTPLVRSFEYAANGQLAGETTPDGTHISYDVRQHGERRRVAIGTETARVTAEFDSSNRPLKLTEADGTKTTWRYTDAGAVDAESILPTGESARMTLSADRRKRTLSATDSPVISEEFDDAGRVVKLAVEKSPAAGDDMLAAVADGIVPMEDMLTQHWHPDGTLRSLDFKTHAIIPEYDPLGRVKRVMRVKPNGSDRFSEWQETRLDEAGRVVEVQDCAGGKVAIGYDAQGNVVNVTNTRIKAEGNERKEEQTRYSFQHDAHGRITGVDSPGGRETCEYDTSGDPLAVRVRRGQAEAQVDFSDGRPRRLRQFDGSTVEFDYQTEGPASGQIKQVSTPVIGLNYHYDEQGRLAEVACGDACRVIYGYDSDGNLASLEYAPPVAELHP
jgi:YD repeat-containing protein